jgi:aminopeptidase N
MQGCHGKADRADLEPGVSVTLAGQRAAVLGDVRYDLWLTIPAESAAPIFGRALIGFALTDASEPVVIDFAPGAEHVVSVSANGQASRFGAVNGHIVVPDRELTPGQNTIEIDFRAGDAPLNRSTDLLYTLFVPARAHHAIPVFDQPDLKARFNLELTLPAEWQAVSNGAELSRESAEETVRIRFAETEPIPTYLFAFAAGRFETASAERNGRSYRMFHRETDAAKIERNRNEIFDLHASALAWLERYTGIAYPFGKFDFVAIPSFQFNGMEHPGAIYYRDSSILLDESATETQMLDRAGVIAHETAHMWFGDLVTMRWFDDVWLKEVFANFMAAKIVNPSFPSVNHDLRFLVAHYPRAYSVDRTAGTHPIRQQLDNLDDAGSLYGPIIYQKAPIVMRQLERMLGAEPFRAGLRVYLERFAFGNATWLDLVGVLEGLGDLDVSDWSRTWVEEAGRPSIRTQVERGSDGGIERLAFVQSDTSPGGQLRWTQQMEVLLGTRDGLKQIPVSFDAETVEVGDAASLGDVDFVLPAGGGLAYGAFTLDQVSRNFLLQHLPELDDPVARGAAWVTLWDELLEGRVAPSQLVDLAARALPSEDTEQNVQLVLDYVNETFWRFLSAAERRDVAPPLEAVLRTRLGREAASPSMKATYFAAFRSIVTTPEGTAFLDRIWRRDERIPGLTLSETDEADMALALAVRGVPAADDILQTQRQRFMNADRKARFEFVMPALSSRQEARDAFFASLADARNRDREPWAVEGLAYLNHPLRAHTAEKYLLPALELLPEIQRTGDIFFPKNWTDALLGGHNTESAAETVRGFLATTPDLPARLRRVVLQSSDGLYRAADTPAR